MGGGTNSGQKRRKKFFLPPPPLFFGPPPPEFWGSNELAVVNGVGTNFGVGVEEARTKGRERGGGGSWGGDSQPLLTNYRGFAGAL